MIPGLDAARAGFGKLKLLESLQNVTSDQLTPDLLRQVVETFNLPIPLDRYQEVLDLAQSETPEPILQWAQRKHDDGSFARFVNPDVTSGFLFHRCSHCHQPEMINLKELQS